MLFRISRAIFPHVRSFALVALLGGCNFWIAGHSKDYALVVHGEGVANPGDGTTDYTLRADGKTDTCKGHSKPLEKPGDSRHWASNEMTCTDGRTAKGETVLESMEWGTGTGTDSCGNDYVMYFHINQYVVQRKLEEFRAQQAAHPGGVDRCDASRDAPPHREPLI